MALFDADAHEPLTATAWDEDRARAGIERIVEQTVAAFEPGRFWPRSDLDVYGFAAETDRALWLGASGVLWALETLGAGLGEAELYERYLAEPDAPGSVGLMFGETGVLLVSWRLSPSPEKEDRLFELVADNARNPEQELFNGSPGTMHAARHLFDATGDERWREAWQASADFLWEYFRPDPELGCRMWVQYRRGRLIRSVGCGHGFASNTRSLLRGGGLLGDGRRAELHREAVATMAALALREDGLVNWPTTADRYWAEQFPTRVQWCHGAPGLVTSVYDLPPDEELDALLLPAGELVWHAGPLQKGAGLCHGTAGNGIAFLALHERTGDEVWLDRARAFAMHALGQVDSTPPRHSLWTGDIGVALYLRDCIAGACGGLPVVDYL